MAENWTPGPWRAYPNPGGAECFEIGTGEVASGEGGWDEWCVATAWENAGDGATKANAHLCAAAPEMYEALKAIQQFCDDPQGGEKPETLARGLARLLPAARAALSKARGED